MTEFYPHLDNKELQKKISLKKEFRYKYDGEIVSVQEKSKTMCKRSSAFELSPHQEFVKKFISYQNPYNSLLLYHGLGSGKTCSAISITESLRMYSKYIPNFKKILMVASPNVQENFKLQLFDPSKLTRMNGLWNLHGCVGNTLLKELNIDETHAMNRDDLIHRIKKVIKDNYSFIGYGSFANFIEKQLSTKNPKRIQNTFSSRVIVIDEIHNIRITEKSSDSIGKKIASMLNKLVHYVKGIKFIFLTGTPMYNDPKEIIYLLNLMNLNDGRSVIQVKDVFTDAGDIKEGGKELLQEKANGYISYVRGENPYAFPYMVTPSMYQDPNSSLLCEQPTVQFNEKKITAPIEHLDLYRVSLSEIQEDAYLKTIQQIEEKKTEEFENLDSLGYNDLMKPIQSLLITYPHETGFYTGDEGLQYVMNYRETLYPPSRNEFVYNDTPLKDMFTYENIGKYSSKMKSLLDHIIDSKGIVLIYSQYINGGLVPIALALEELGFKRYGEKSKTLFRDKKPDLNVYNMKQDPTYKGKFKQAKYSIISGEKMISPDNNEEIYGLTHDNEEGQTIKVVLISQAGTEGIDLKNVRQVHVMEPWYNLNRIEQIIGRARRNCSHSMLPLHERNFTLFLYVSILSDTRIESLDGLLYRMAEKKSIKIGRVSRILKSVSVDCLLNQEQQNFAKMTEKITLLLSNGQKIKYDVKDKPFSSLCDYSKTCEYDCYNKVGPEYKEDLLTYSYKDTQNNKLEDKVKALFNHKHVYTKKELIRNIHAPMEEILRTLTDMIEHKTPISDKYSKIGYMTQIADLYLFQPMELNDPRTSVYDRMRPIPIKPKTFVLTQEKERTKEKEDDKEKGNGNGNEKHKQRVSDKVALLENLYNQATHPKEDPEEDWYQLFSKASEYMKTHRGLTNEEIDKYLIIHLCEQLTIEKEVDILQELYSRELNDFEKKLKAYYDEKIVERQDTKAIGLLAKEGIRSILVIYVWNEGGNLWRKATPTEQSIFKDMYTFNKSNLYSTIGFMGYYTDNSYQFKIRDKKNPDTRGSYLLIKKKSDIIDFMNDVLFKKVIFTKENTKKESITRTELTILSELYMRHLDSTKKERYFLSKVEYHLYIEKN